MVDDLLGKLAGSLKEKSKKAEGLKLTKSGVSYIDQGTLKDDDIPGYCFVVKPEDINRTFDAIEGAAVPAEVIPLDSVGSYQDTKQHFHSVYEIPLGSEALRVIVPKDSRVEALQAFKAELEENDVSFVPAFLCQGRDGLGQMLGMSECPLESITPFSFHETEKAIITRAVNLGMISREVVDGLEFNSAGGLCLSDPCVS